MKDLTDNYRFSPKISIVMSFHKEPLQWIRLSVQSILSQTFKDFEFIIICDNPHHKEGIDYIRKTVSQDSRIKFKVNDSNIGLTRSLNYGIMISEGEYIARMDADDIACPERLEIQACHLDNHPDTAICATDAHIINDEGKTIRRNKYKGKYHRYGLFITNTVAHSSVMFRRSITESRQPIYNEDYKYAQDYELWQFLLLKGYRIDFIPRPLLLYRKSDIQISTANQSEQSEHFRKAHRAFIMNWLNAKGIVTSDNSDLPQILNDVGVKLNSFKGEDHKNLILIIYLLYYSLILVDWRYGLKYIMDRNMIIFRINPLLTYRLLTAKKARRRRTSLI